MFRIGSPSLITHQLLFPQTTKKAYLSCGFATINRPPSGAPSGPKPKLDSVNPASLVGEPYGLRSGASEGANALERPTEPLRGPGAANGSSIMRSDFAGTIAASRLRRCRLSRQNASRARAIRTSAPPAAPPATAPTETLDLALNRSSTL